MPSYEQISGTVEDVIYANPDNGYTVCDITSDEKTITAVGNMPYITEGEYVILTGSYVTHADYGEQFKVEYFERKMPEDDEAIFMYLSSGVIKGIRRSTAQKIVDKFGKDSLNIIANFPDELAKIKGISKDKAISISENFAKIRTMQDTIILLQKYSVSANLAMKAYNTLGENAVDKIKANPYLLCEVVDGISFKTADRIAIAMGVSPNSIERIRSATIYFLYHASATAGHTYLPRNILVEQLMQTIGVEGIEIENAIVSLSVDKRIYLSEVGGISNVAVASLYLAETNISNQINKMVGSKYTDLSENANDVIKNINEEGKIKLAPLQEKAVETACMSGVMVLTGGPGTGKTTTIRAIIKALAKSKLKIVLAAPTGRAAKRMSELASMEAKTLHRLLEYAYNDSERELVFGKDADNPIEADVVIVDEMSMVDVYLLSALLKAMPNGARLIMTGDADQLPSVGAGNVLKDIMESGIVRVIKLTEVFRQAKESLIITNAHNINKGEYPVLTSRDNDFFFLDRNTPEEIVQSVALLCKERLPKSYNIDPMKDIQVISPAKKSQVGVNVLNARLQQELNPPDLLKNEHKYGDILFREGDRVMQIKNNYNTEWVRLLSGEEGSGVYNGDMGFIEAIDANDRVIMIIFDEDKRVMYSFNQLEEIDLAYAVTVHKSQGSEFDYIVMPMYSTAPMLMCRNLLYTAVTRAKKMVILVGRKNVAQIMVDNNSEKKRYTLLGYKLREKK